MNEDILKGAKIISKFCRLNINTKKELPLRASQIGFLIYVINSNEEITPVIAAKFFGVTKAVITKTIKPLVEKGYITCSPSEADRRSYIIVATQKSRELIHDVDNEYYKVINELYKKMGINKYKQLLSLLDEANQVIEQLK